MRNLLNSIVLSLAGAGVYYLYQIFFVHQEKQQMELVQDLTNELSDIKQVIAQMSIRSTPPPKPDIPEPTAIAPSAPVAQPKPESTRQTAIQEPLPEPPATQPKPAANPRRARNSSDKPLNPFKEKLDKEQLLAAIVRAVKAQTEGDTPVPVSPSGIGVEMRVVQGVGDSVIHYFYTVQPGDSLRSIAQNFFGDGSQYMRIYQTNKRLLASPDEIRVGQRLRIPPKG